MTRQLILLTSILTTCLISCRQRYVDNQNHEMQTNKNQVDTSVIAVLPFDKSLDWIFKSGKPTDLTTADLVEIETILKKCVDEYNPEQERQFQERNDKHPAYKLDKKNFIIDLSRYKRQYMGIINSKGEKEVWVNCFCGQ